MKTKGHKFLTASFLLIVGLTLIYSCKKNQDQTMDTLGAKGPLSLQPSSGAAGTLVTIQGSGFNSDLAKNTVVFGKAPANMVSANDSVLVVQAPQGGTTGVVQVTVGSKTAPAGMYTFQNLSIHSVTPINGPTGTNVRVTGAGFGNAISPVQITINGKPSIITSVSDTLLVAAVPTNVGTGPVVIKVNGQTATGPDFIYQSISAIGPLTGGPGTIVTITGTGFNAIAAQNTINFNGVTAKVRSATATSIVATVLKGVTTGPVSVTINGQRTVGPVFTVVPVPTVSSIAATSGPAGIKVKINGANFSANLGENNVSFNGKAAIVDSAASTTLVVTTPAGVTSGHVSVSVNQQVVSGPVFTVQSLGIATLSPDNGLDGTTVTITGTGFSTVPANNLVYFNGKAATVTSASAGKLVVSAPAGSSTGLLTVKVGTLSAAGPVFTHAGVITLYGAVSSGSILGYYASGIAADGNGNVYVSDQNHIVKIASNGTASVFAGDPSGQNTGYQDGQGTSALFNGPGGMSVDAQGNLLVADGSNQVIRKITQGGLVSTYKNVSPVSVTNFGFDANGFTYVTDRNSIVKIFPNGSSTQINSASPSGDLAVHPATGNVYFSVGPCCNDATMHRIDATDGDQMFAGTRYNPGDQDGPFGTGQFNSINSIALDPTTETLIVVDNSLIRQVSLTGVISTITGRGDNSGAQSPQDGSLGTALFYGPQALTVDKNGVIYVLERNPDFATSSVREVITH